MDSRAPREAGSYTNLKNRKSIAHRHVIVGIAQSPHGHRAETARSKTARWCHGHRTISAQPLHGSRMGSIRLPSGGNSTEIAQFPYYLRAASVWLYPSLPPRARTRNCTMLVVNVNTCTVARSHLRYPKNRTENRRQFYCTAPGANVN